MNISRSAYIDSPVLTKPFHANAAAPIECKPHPVQGQSQRATQGKGSFLTPGQTSAFLIG